MPDGDTRPVVSVVVPTRDRADTLPRAIESVLRQTCSRHELIVVDDGSTDRTPAVLAGFDDPRLRVHRFDRPRGANAARNRGVELAEGEYVSFLDSDDELRPGHLERVVASFRALHEACVCVSTACELLGASGESTVTSLRERFVDDEEILEGRFVGKFSCLTFRRSVFGDVGLLDEELPSSQDYDFLIRTVGAGYRVYHLGEVLVTCHQAPGRISDSPERRIRGGQRVLEKHRDRLGDAAVSRLHYYIGFGHAHAGNLPAARQRFRRSIRLTPGRLRSYIHLLAALHPASFELLLKLKRLLGTRLISPLRRLHGGATESRGDRD